MPVAYDPTSEFAQDEMPAHSPGFYYSGPAEGEVETRNRFYQIEAPGPQETQGDRWWRQNASVGNAMREQEAQALAESVFRQQAKQAFEDRNVRQQEDAVRAALQYQGQRQLQHDLDSGVNPAVALARSWHALGNRTGLGSVMRAANPPTSIGKEPMTVHTESVLDPATGLAVPNKLKVFNDRGAFKIIDTAQRPNETVTEKFPAITPSPEQPGSTNFFGRVTAPVPEVAGQPERIVTRRGVGAPFPLSPVQPRGTNAGPIVIQTKAEYDALPSGTVYISNNGKPHRKP